MDNYAKEAKFSSMPLLKSERMYGLGDSIFANTGYGIATWCFLTGGLLASIVSFKMAIVTALAGNLIGTLLVALAVSIISHKYGRKKAKELFVDNPNRIVTNQMIE